MAVLRAAVGLEKMVRHRKAVALAAAVGIDDPAGELLEARLDVEVAKLGEVEQPKLGAECAVFLHEER